jgi:GDPmannose 4,6-dehydratase
MKALITGITGQDGSYMAEFLLEKGYEVFGIMRRSSQPVGKNLVKIKDKCTFYYGDMTDFHSLLKAIYACEPDEIYNFAAQSFVPTSYANPIYTFNVNATGVMNLLEIVKAYPNRIKVYQASSSEMFGNTAKIIKYQDDHVDTSYAYETLDETSDMVPISPYALSKLSAHKMCEMYRDVYNMHIVNGILFNHESSRRGQEFVTQKIVQYMVGYVPGNVRLLLGNNSMRDWTDARDMIRGIWLMMQKPKPETWVLGRGKTNTVKEVVDIAFNVNHANPLEWDGLTASYEGEVIVEFNDDEYKRGIDIKMLLSNPAKAYDELDWEPEISLKDMIINMFWMYKNGGTKFADHI